jgi:hypothetical protein
MNPKGASQGTNRLKKGTKETAENPRKINNRHRNVYLCQTRSPSLRRRRAVKIRDKGIV